MCHRATVFAVYAVVAISAFGQAPQLDWRRVGNTALDLNLASPASGPVDRVWRSADRTRLFIRTAAGRVFETTDYENWKPASEVPPEIPAIAVERMPEAGAKVRLLDGRRERVYAAGGQAWRSDDGGVHWTNLTEFRSSSILGGALSDLAVSADNPDDIVVAGRTGVWRSLDGGLTWTGLNQSLPNLPLRRILHLPSGTRPLRIATAAGEAEWRPGEKTAWRVTMTAAPAEEARRRELAEGLGAEIRSLATAGDAIYAGSPDGRIFATTNAGRTWQRFAVGDGGAVESIWVDPSDAMFAVAGVSGRQRGRVLRTTNGGVFWEDLSDSVPLAGVRAVAADRASGAIYAATDRGVYLGSSSAPGSAWTLLSAGLPDAPAIDLRLDEGANQLYIALDGYGVYATIAPHRLRDPRVVSAGDLRVRPAAPGALLTVIGSRIDAARAGDQNMPVLAAGSMQSQIQVPFEAAGSRLALALSSSSGTTTHTLPLQDVSPAIFVDADGSPLVTNADTGLLLDASSPVSANARLQIFATGLGAVQPAWPTGVPAPLDAAPRVAAPVRVYLDREPLEVMRATLAPGYVGFYLIEVNVPSIVNAGTAELYVEADGQESNRVKIYIEP